MSKLAPFIIVGATLGLAGCISTTPHWDARFGESTRTLMTEQLIDPTASGNPDPVAGIDGKAAKAAIGEYNKSYTEPQTQPRIFTIGVGGGSGN